MSGKTVALGNAAMMADLGVDAATLAAQADALQADGKTAMFVAVDGKLAGIVAVADPIKATTAEAIRALHDSGLRIIMATGDNERTAKADRAAGSASTRCAPACCRKARRRLVDELRARGAGVAMAGDGVNDAPALAAADVGIAMGTGADVAIESAGITLVKGDLNGIVRARTLAAGDDRATSARTCSSPSSTMCSACRSPPACSIRVIGMLLSPMLAAAAMSLSSVSVIANALRLRTLKL